MKRILLFALALAMILSVMVVPSFAKANWDIRHPKGYYDTNMSHAEILGKREFQALAKNATTVDDPATEDVNEGDATFSVWNLGENLAAPLQSAKEFGIDFTTVDNGAELKADLANYEKYGISLIGAKKVNDRHLKGISDGTWNVGNKVIGDVCYGAGGWVADGKFYNEKGEAVDAIDADHPYLTMLTYNFDVEDKGVYKSVDYIIMGGNNSDKCTHFIAAADVYVSNDGINWTHVTYYDIIEQRMQQEIASGDDRILDGYHLGTDATGTAGTANSEAFGIKLNGVVCKYLRLAFTSGQSITAPAGTGVDGARTYEDYQNAITTGMGSREYLIIGQDAEAPVEKETNFVGYQLSALDTENNNFDLRLVADIDSLDYKSAGFDVKITTVKSITNGTVPKVAGFATTNPCTKAYSSINYLVANGTTAKWNAGTGKYLIAFTIEDIDIDPGTTCNLIRLEITPYVVDANDKKISGDTYVLSIADNTESVCMLKPAN